MTVVFADLIGFTDLSARSTPSEIVGMLNKLYSQYDEIAQRHGLFKVEMVGDEYMALAGMPTVLAQMEGEQREKAGQHWRAALDYAIDVQQAVESFVTHAGSKVGVRIGIATGPVVAALIGDSRSRYQVFGGALFVWGGGGGCAPLLTCPDPRPHRHREPGVADGEHGTRARDPGRREHVPVSAADARAVRV